jgi:predicted XRE-type DNA-binding protein
MSKDDFEPIRGSGNVFRDFDDPDADLKQAKAILAGQIIGILDDRKLTVRKAAGMTGFAAADFSRVRSADLGRFTLDRMIRMLRSLDDSIEVTIQIAPRTDDRRAPLPT